MSIFSTSGPIANSERSIIITALILMLAVVVPVILTTFFFAFKYRDGKKSKHDPNLDRDPKLQILWPLLLSIIILVLANMAWKGSHALDPRKTLQSDTPPMTIQVVALQWKWLFIYPAQNIATINFVEFPTQTSINFEITADAPMNTFWIPQLGGQIYAMNGMHTQLHLMADQAGAYPGYSTNISGAGFADMKFTAQAVSASDFASWVTEAKQSKTSLTFTEYEQLAKPNTAKSPYYYSSAEPNLFQKIIDKFTTP